MNHLAPSILAADFGHLAADVQKVEEVGVTYLHIDVMDGAFVPSISLGMPVIRSIRKSSKLFFDVHLMVEEPGRFIDEFVDCGADMITVHVEACKHLDKVLDAIRKKGIKAGVVLNPATSLSTIEYVLDKVDMVLLMCVNPGFGGQKYISYSTRKIKELREMIESRGLDIDIEVDGGVKLGNLEEVLEAGANVVVAGSAIFEGNIEENTKAFLKVMNR